MTSTSYTALFVAKDGKKLFRGSIFWDKHQPAILTAALCPVITTAEVGAPVWNSTILQAPTAKRALVDRLKARAKRLNLTLRVERTVIPGDEQVEASGSFDGFEIHPCVRFDDKGKFYTLQDTPPADVVWNDEVCEPNDPNLAMWTVYGYRTDVGMTALSDHATEALAIAEEARLSAALRTTALPSTPSHAEAPKYKVEHRFSYGWDDAGWTEDDEALRFPTIESANTAIAEFLTDSAAAVKRGNTALGYKARDFRAVPDVPVKSLPEIPDKAVARGRG